MILMVNILPKLKININLSTKNQFRNLFLIVLHIKLWDKSNFHLIRVWTNLLTLIHLCKIKIWINNINRIIHTSVIQPIEMLIKTSILIININSNNNLIIIMAHKTNQIWLEDLKFDTRIKIHYWSCKFVNNNAKIKLIFSKFRSNSLKNFFLKLLK